MNFEQYVQAIQEDRVIALSGEVNTELHLSLRHQANEILAKHKGEIVVTLTSEGGCVTDGVAMYCDLLALHRIRGLWIICQAEVASASIRLLPAVPLERRAAFAETQFRFHPPRMYWKQDGLLSMAEHEHELRRYAASVESLRREQEGLVTQLAASTKRPANFWDKVIQEHRILSVYEAQEHSLIGNILI